MHFCVAPLAFVVRPWADYDSKVSGLWVPKLSNPLGLATSKVARPLPSPRARIAAHKLAAVCARVAVKNGSRSSRRHFTVWGPTPTPEWERKKVV